MNWVLEWIETWRVAPPFSRRRRHLLAAIREAENADPGDWVEIEGPR